jgi:hypothetical protein
MQTEERACPLLVHRRYEVGQQAAHDTGRRPEEILRLRWDCLSRGGPAASSDTLTCQGEDAGQRLTLPNRPPRSSTHAVNNGTS